MVNNSSKSSKSCKMLHWGWMQKRAEMFWDILSSFASVFEEEEAHFYSIKFHIHKIDNHKHTAIQGIHKNSVAPIESSGNKNC